MVCKHLYTSVKSISCQLLVNNDAVTCLAPAGSCESRFLTGMAQWFFANNVLHAEVTLSEAPGKRRQCS